MFAFDTMYNWSIGMYTITKLGILFAVGDLTVMILLFSEKLFSGNFA